MKCQSIHVFEVNKLISSLQRKIKKNPDIVWEFGK